MEARPRPPAPRKAPKFLDAKIMIAALSAAVTVGFWNLFAGQALAVENVQAKQPPQPEDESAVVMVDLPVEDAQANGLPPVPTLVPLMDLSGLSAGAPSAAPAAAQPGSSAPLRSVTAPTVVVVQKNKPVVDSSSVTVVSRGGGSSPRPAASSRSSR